MEGAHFASTVFPGRGIFVKREAESKGTWLAFYRFRGILWHSFQFENPLVISFKAK